MTDKRTAKRAAAVTVPVVTETAVVDDDGEATAITDQPTDDMGEVMAAVMDAADDAAEAAGEAESRGWQWATLEPRDDGSVDVIGDAGTIGFYRVVPVAGVRVKLEWRAQQAGYETGRSGAVYCSQAEARQLALERIFRGVGRWRIQGEEEPRTLRFQEAYHPVFSEG